MFEQPLDEARQGEALVMERAVTPGSKKLYLESYGCAMNFSDSEIVASILGTLGYETTPQAADADIILLNTCAIRDNAEQKIWQRLKSFKAQKKKKPAL